MKVKTFILTFLMMMSSPFLFGQHWTDPDLGSDNGMPIAATIYLDGSQQTSPYQVAAFYENTLLEVQTITAFEIPENYGGGYLYHIDMNIPNINAGGSMNGIYFKFFDGTKEYVSVEEVNYNEDGIGIHTNPYQINFKTVAQIEGEYDVVYPSLQDAIDAVENGETITLLDNNAENVTVVQAPNMAFTIDGAEKTMTGTITVNGKSAAYETAGLTIKNVNFDATGIADASIMLGGNNNIRYTNGVTVENCNFTGSGQTKVAIKNYTGGCKNLTVTGGTFSGLHSLMQVKGVNGINVSGVNVTECENGIAVGTSTNVAISNSTIAATVYGVRADGEGAYTMTLTHNTISAELPVVVRKATGNYNLTIAGENNSYTASNTNAYQVVFTNGDDGTYEAPTGEFSLTVSEGTELNVYPVYEAKIGNVKYLTLAEAIAAVGAGDVVIELLADATFDYNARDAYGTAETTSLTINGNGKTLTLNQKNSDWASLGLANTDAKLVLNKMTIEKTGYGDTNGAWNTHAIIFSCPLEMTGVTVNNSMAVQNGATLNNVVINEANGFYGLWINGNGQSVTMNGGSITATNGGRGIKIADQYIDNPVSVALNVTGTSFNTAKKAAVLVSSTAGAAITASNVNITNVAEDNVNFAWVDEDWAANYGKVTVTGATLSQENLSAFATAIKVDDNVQGYYKTLAEAIAAVGENSTVEIELLKDIALDAMLTVNKNRTITLDLNGKTITGTDDTSKNFSLIDNRGTLTVTGEGTMTLTAKVDSDWNRYSAVIANNPGGKLIIENGTFEHLGGTDMAYGIDNLTNGKGTYAETVINGGTIKSTYRGIRQFLNGIEAQNILTVNGGTIEGANKSIWMHDPSAKANTGTLIVGENASLVGDVYLFVTAGSTEWPVEISIAAAALQGESTVLTANLPAGVDVQNINGTYSKVNVVAAIGETKYQTLDAAFTAAQSGDEVKILVAGTYALSTSGKNITITGAVDGVVFDNIGAKNMGSANVTFNNVTFDYYPNVNYTGLQHSGNLVYNNCIINGQVFLYGTSEKFNNCTFNQNSADAYNVWTYGAKEVAFNECTFNSVGKSVLIYSEDKNLFNNVAVTKCTFAASAPVDGKAAIEMDSSLTAGIYLTIDGETTATGFGSGNVSNNSLWNNKKGNQGANNDITVTVNDVVVLAPTTVAKIGEKEYQLLQKAVNDATATNVIDVVGTTTENITIAENANITLNFAENVVLNGYIAPFKGNLTISGGTINNTNADYSAIEINAGELNLENVKVSSARHGVRIDGAVTATINGGEYTLNATSGTRHAVNVSGAANVTIQAGTFVGPKGTTMDSGSAVCVQTGATVTIEGGNFSGGKNATLGVSDTMTVIGGTFDQDPSAYVSLPYVVIKNDNVYNVIKGVAKIGETYYASLASAIAGATAGNTIELLTDVEENVTVNKSVTIDGGNKNYTGKMDVRASITIKNVKFDGKGMNTYAVETRSAANVVIEDCTAKNYSYGFLQIASNNNTATIKNVTISDVNYGVKVDYSNSVVLENVKIDAAVAAVLNSNYGQKTITIKNSKLSILGTWKRNNTIKTYYEFIGANTIDEFITEESIDVFKLAEADATLTAPEGLTVTTSVENSLVKYEDGKYVVKSAVAKIGDVYYETLTEAINAATAGDEILIIAENGVTEDVAVNKDLTINGNNKDYTGNISVKGSTVDVIVKNVNFVNGTGYAITTNTIKSVTVENCTVTNYGYGFLYANKSTPTVAVKNVTVDGANYGMHWVYGTTATLENVTMKNVVYGLYIQNYASKTINVKSCNISSIAIWERNGYSGVQTFKFEGASTVGTLESSQYAKYVLAEANATLAAQEGLNVTTNVTDHVVEYNEGVYSVVAANVELLSNEGVSKGKFATLQQAIDAAQSGDEIVLLADINLDETEFVLLDNSYDTYFKVEGKSVTINLNGKKISGSYTGTNTMLVGVFSTDNNGHLTLKDENTEGVTAEINVTATNTVYSLIANYEDGCSITIEGGTYVLDNASDSHMYTGGDEGIIVYGGTFKLGNVGTGTNGKPWMFNTLGGNERNVVVNGGTFSTDVNHQFWANEVYVPETKALSQNADGTWTVVESVAYVTERATSTGANDRKVGYATLAEAVVAKAIDNTVTMLKDVELANTLTIAAGNEVVLDLNEKVVSQTTEFTASYSMITNNGKLTIGNGTLKLEDLSEGGSSNWGTYIVENHGELIVNNAKLEHLGTVGDNFSTCIPIQNYQGKVTVNEGAEISSPEFRSLRDFTAGGEIIINGGKFNGQIWMQGLGNGSSSLTINGGEFGPTANDGSSVFITNGTNVINVSILGGNFNTKIGATNAEKEGVKGCIKGGYFTTTAKENTNAALLNENFAFVANDDATYTWTVMPTQKQSLVAGWNWYSSYLNITSSDLITAVDTNATQIKGQTQADGFMDYVPEFNSWSGSLTIDFAKMYMINTTQACEMKLAAELVNPQDYTVKLHNGWTWIGYPSNKPVAVSEAFANLTPKDGDIIKTRNSGHAEYAWGMWVGTLKTMIPGEGYMYRNTDGVEKSFVYNVGTRGSVEANMTAENNYWTPNSAEYPFNMTITAVLDGEMMNDNYEIAAFVNGEVRGSARPIYVEPLDAYMFFLTIHGDDVEEMTFRCYDLTSGEEYMLDNRMNYSNDAIVGSVNEPYVFSRGTTGIGEASMSEINIYPNPTTIGTEINLQATCDKVEVFNALGVKLAEYQNVDSIDAIETAGIYVIRITNDSNVQNCRLVVK